MRVKDKTLVLIKLENRGPINYEYKDTLISKFLY